MDLMQRYLHAVAGHLPQAQADDIVNELRDGLLSRVEEQEARLGRPLSAQEQEALLRERGHPLLVATSYLPQQWLVGPALFPYWRLGLRYVLVGAALLHVVQLVLAMGDGRAFVQLLVQAGFAFVGTAVSLAGLLTLVLAVVEHSGARLRLLDGWSPARLPASDSLLRISRSESLASVLFGLLVLGWWSGLVPLPFASQLGGGASVTLAATWQTWYLPVLGLMTGNVALAAANFVAPQWDRVRLGINLALNAATIGVAAALVRSGPLVVGAAGSELPARLVHLLDLSLRVTLVVIALVALIECVRTVQRLRCLARS
jgi:hypothetical protein